MSFMLHPQLEADSTFICKLKLCQMRLMDNALFPWVILIPEQSNLVEITDLTGTDYAVLSQEIYTVTGKLKSLFRADKMNVATLGNQVPQLHIHIIARVKGDEAWPAPVWGKGTKPYGQQEKTAIIAKLAGVLTIP